MAQWQKVPIHKTMGSFASFVMFRKVYDFARRMHTAAFQAALSLKKGCLNLARNDKLLSYKT